MSKKPFRVVCGFYADDTGVMRRMVLGRAWDNEDGTVGIRLDALPLTRKLLIGPTRVPSPQIAPHPAAPPWTDVPVYWEE